MKLEPYSKPIRIRIMSGGEEHATLDSLLHNFKVEDVSPLIPDKRLARWLHQQNQSELAENVEKIDVFKCDEENSYKDLLRIFFSNEFVGTDSTIEICKRIKSNYPQTSSHILDSILSNGWCSVDAMTIIDIYKENSELTLNWRSYFEKYGSSLQGFGLYRYAKTIEESCMHNDDLMKYGKSLLFKAAKSGCEEAKKHLCYDFDVKEEVDKFIENPEEYDFEDGYDDDDENIPWDSITCLLTDMSILYADTFEYEPEEIAKNVENDFEDIKHYFQNEANYLIAIAMWYGKEPLRTVKDCLRPIKDNYRLADIMYKFINRGERTDSIICRDENNLRHHIIFVAEELKRQHQ